MQPVIEVNQVTKEFRLGQLTNLTQSLRNGVNRALGRPVNERAPFKALNDVSFTVEPGEVLGIIGHNGAGKSTLLKLLARISVPSKGRVTVRGRVAPLIEVGAGMVADMTGRENVFLNAAILGMKRDEIKRKFDEIVAFAELEEFIDTPVKRYSSGMQVRLGFAIATAVESEILIVDEVLAVGDLAFQQKCIDRMEKLIRGDGRTVLLVGHNIRQIERICSRVMLLDHGRVTHTGTPKDVCGIFFREAQERNLERHTSLVGQITPQRDAGIIEVQSIELLDDSGTELRTVGLHEPLTLRIKFSCSQPLRRPEVIIGFHTSDFVHVLAVSSAMSQTNPDLAVGTHEVTCRLVDIPLRPFSYGLRLTFLDQYQNTYWYADNILPTVVTAGRYDITKMPTSGLVDVPATWKFS
ncbi:MAG: ABC transporter ATP-binding protein [Pseudomonadota bacterium]|nr:ABC transporter ATP-binding protein [Pseudomonadota bacterium]